MTDSDFTNRMVASAQEILALALKLAVPTCDTDDEAQAHAHAAVLLEMANAMIISKNVRPEHLMDHLVECGRNLHQLTNAIWAGDLPLSNTAGH